MAEKKTGDDKVEESGVPKSDVKTTVNNGSECIYPGDIFYLEDDIVTVLKKSNEITTQIKAFGYALSRASPGGAFDYTEKLIHLPRSDKEIDVKYIYCVESHACDEPLAYKYESDEHQFVVYNCPGSNISREHLEKTLTGFIRDLMSGIDAKAAQIEGSRYVSVKCKVFVCKHPCKRHKNRNIMQTWVQLQSE